MSRPDIVDLDNREKIAFRKTFRIPLPDPQSASWEDLHEMRSNLIEAMEKLIDKCEKDDRNISEEENQAMEIANDFLNSIQTEFQNREERGQKGPIDYSNGHLKPSFGASVPVKKDFLAVEGRKYFEMFPNARETSEFRDMAEFVEVLASGRYDPRLERRTFAETQGETGGFAVPSEYSAMLLDKSLENEIVRARATVYAMEAPVRHIPAWDNDEHTDNLFGGFSGEWLAEAQSATVQTGKLRSMTLTAHKLAIYTEASREVLADGMGFDQQIGSALVKAIGFYLDKDFLTGNGAGRPQGILNAPSIITVTRQTASQVNWQDVFQLVSLMRCG